MKFNNFVKFSVVIATVFFCLSFGMRRVEATTYVVMVAVEDYMREKALLFTKSDAIKLRDKLIRCGVISQENVILMTSDTNVAGVKYLATKDRIEEVIAEVLSKAKEGDTIIIFLSGHGTEVNGMPYFCPLNSGGSQASLVSLGDIITAFGRCKAKHKLMIVDACRSGNTSGAFAALKATQGVTLLQSCESGESSMELIKELEIGGEVIKPGGIFSTALLEGLSKAKRDTSGNITLLTLTAYTMQRTREIAAKLGAKQTPHLQGNMTDFPIVSKPPTDDDIADARKNVKATVVRILPAVLEKLTKDNPNPDRNPFNDARLAGTLANKIGEEFMDDYDMVIARYGLLDDEAEMVALKKELFTDPVQAAIVVARKKWNEDNDAAIATAATEAKQKEAALAELKRLLSSPPAPSGTNAWLKPLQDAKDLKEFADVQRYIVLMEYADAAKDDTLYFQARSDFFKSLKRNVTSSPTRIEFILAIWPGMMRRNNFDGLKEAMTDIDVMFDRKKVKDFQWLYYNMVLAGFSLAMNDKESSDMYMKAGGTEAKYLVGFPNAIAWKPINFDATFKPIYYGMYRNIYYHFCKIAINLAQKGDTANYTYFITNATSLRNYSDDIAFIFAISDATLGEFDQARLRWKSYNAQSPPWDSLYCLSYIIRKEFLAGEFRGWQQKEQVVSQISKEKDYLAENIGGSALPQFYFDYGRGIARHKTDQEIMSEYERLSHSSSINAEELAFFMAGVATGVLDKRNPK